ncbi:hypothetical protein [Pseudomonas ogarae]
MMTFASGQSPVPDVDADLKPGHTPDSAAYSFTSQDQSICL